MEMEKKISDIKKMIPKDKLSDVKKMIDKM